MTSGTTIFAFDPLGLTTEGARILRGTLEGNNAARLDLAQALTELLAEMPNAQFAKLRDIIQEWRTVDRSYQLLLTIAQQNRYKGGDVLELLLERCLEASRRQPGERTSDAIKQIFVTLVNLRDRSPGMSANPGSDIWRGLVTFTGILSTTQPLSIGDGKRGARDRTDPDVMVMRRNGKAFVPSTTLRGVTRDCVEKLVRAPINFKLGGERGVNQHQCQQWPLCDVCCIFGVPLRQAARATFFDCMPLREVDVVRQTTTANDRVTNSAGQPVTWEVIEPGARFSFMLKCNLYNDRDVQLVKLLLQGLLLMQELGVGRKRAAAGYGRVELEELKGTWQAPEHFLNGLEPTMLFDGLTFKDVVRQFDEWSAPLRG